IVAEQYRHATFSPGDLVYLNIGSKDGVQAGDYFHIVQDAVIGGAQLQLAVGTLKILGTLPKTSLALVHWCEYDLKPGAVVEKFVMPQIQELEQPTPAA